MPLCSVKFESMEHFCGIIDNLVIGWWHWIMNSIIKEFAKNAPRSSILHGTKARAYNGNIVY